MPLAPAPHIMVVVAPYYRAISDQLFEGTTAALRDAGATWDRFDVAGAFELPVAVAIAVKGREFDTGQRRYDGYIALGCVIRGETSHYDLICDHTTRALQDLAVANRLALGFGLLTCENGEQAMARAAVDRKNKGAEAANACLRTIELKRTFRMHP